LRSRIFAALAVARAPTLAHGPVGSAHHIPTHATDYFPTPFLWPLPTPFVDGISWATPEFVAANYGALLNVYIVVFFYVRKRKSS